MERIKKILMTKEGRKFFIKDTNKDFHTQYGYISKDDFRKRRPKTNTGKELSCFKPFFHDLYKKMKRGAQIIPLKDLAMIIAETGINNDTVVIDAGSGSGALSLYVAKFAKQVYSFDIREDHLKIAEENRKFLGIKNLKYEKHDIYESIPYKGDVITLDVPEPWKVIDHAAKALRPGGFLVSYSPSIPQIADFVNSIDERFVHLKTIEVSNREWEIDGRRVRPKTKGLGHSGFLAIIRRI
ncbi:MAG: tRNA (adenine-N1)-methyltransferase [Nanobdellota archaeon]